MTLRWMLTMNRLKKAGAVFVILIINLLVFGIIALNVFVIWKDFPQWIMILAAMLDIAVVLLIAKKVFAGKVAKIIFLRYLGSFYSMKQVMLLRHYFRLGILDQRYE